MTWLKILPLCFAILISSSRTVHCAEAEAVSDDSVLARSIAPIFDWSEELIKADVPEKGHRYSELNPQEVGALRRGFKLNLDALIAANSVEDLSNLATLRPLPNPSEPFLPVKSEPQDKSNPFGESKDSTLGPLDRLFLAEGRLKGGVLTGGDSGPVDSADPFADEDPFGNSSLASDDDSMSEEDDNSDPFGSDNSSDNDDPFGGSSEEDDPFADF